MTDVEALQRSAQDHLMLHFTEMAAFDQRALPIITRGDGCYVTMPAGGASSTACRGCSASTSATGSATSSARRRTIRCASSATRRAGPRPIPRTIELAERIASLAPEGLNRVFFTSGGGEANDAMWKLVRQYYLSRGEGQRCKAIARKLAYHGTTLGRCRSPG